MVSSVSGGSITNAHAGLGEPFRLASSDRYGEGATSLVRRLSGRVGAFRASLVVTLVAAAASGLLLVRGDVGPALVAAGRTGHP